MNHAARRAALASSLRQHEYDYGLVTDLINVRYLTGFTGSNGALKLAADGTATLVTDGRYKDQAIAEATDVVRVIARDLLEALCAGASGRVAIETHTVSVDDYARIEKLLPGADLCSLARAVEQLREVKDADEVALIRQACEISTRALQDLFEGPLAGRTERAIARDLELRMLDLGADGIAFETIVATGPNSAIPHHSPTDRVTEGGDLLKIDFGALVDGYHADCTRTVVLGAAHDWQREIYAAVEASQQAGVDALVGGNLIGASKVAADAVLADAGWLEHFTTGLGHGVGLQIHEDPFLHTDHTGKLIPCMTLTMEPGVYLPGRGGVRIEDTLVITGGAAEALTSMTKDLLELA